MIHNVSLLLLVFAFAGAGVFNSLGKPATKLSFVRWGFPAWWCHVTGLTESATALLISIPAIRTIGLVLGAITIAAATLTVLRHREFSHLAPLGLFALLLVTVAVTH
jgi:hypothetical protein